MPDSDQSVWALAAGAPFLAAYAIYRLFASLTRDRFVTDTPLVRIRSAAQGYARIEGHAARSGPEMLAAPLSGRPCVWWEYRISGREEDERGNAQWRELESGTSVTPFAIADADGQCLVGPVGAEVTPTDSDTWYGDTPRPLAGIPHTALLGGAGRSYRYIERLIGPGAPLCVLGELRSHAEEREVEGDVRALLATWKADQSQLLARFDGNHDGHIDSQEWDAARAAARTEAQGNVANLRIERLNVVAQPTHGQPFLIAPMDGPQMARREKLHAWLFLVAAVLLVGLSLWSMHKLFATPTPAVEVDAEQSRAGPP